MVKKQREDKKINVFENFLVPKHEKVSEKEKRELLKKYNISTKQLPKILKGDPAVIALGAKPGDLIKITRDNKIMGEVYYYRLVQKN